MSLLITQSLHNSIEYYKASTGKWRESACESLCNLLSRTYPDKMPLPVRRGIAFEKDVYRICNSIASPNDIDGIKASDLFKEFIAVCLGGRFQTKVKTYVTVDSEEHCVYGKLDVEFGDKIIDIKTKAKWSNKVIDTLLNQLQHHIYCYCKKIEQFEYQVAVFDGDRDVLVSHEVVPYTAMTWEKELDYIKNEISAIRMFMRDNEYFDAMWRTKYSLY